MPSLSTRSLGRRSRSGTHASSGDSSDGQLLLDRQRSGPTDVSNQIDSDSKQLQLTTSPKSKSVAGVLFVGSAQQKKAVAEQKPLFCDKREDEEDKPRDGENGRRLGEQKEAGDPLGAEVKVPEPINDSGEGNNKPVGVEESTAEDRAKSEKLLAGTNEAKEETNADDAIEASHGEADNKKKKFGAKIPKTLLKQVLSGPQLRKVSMLKFGTRHDQATPAPAVVNKEGEDVQKAQAIVATNRTVADKDNTMSETSNDASSQDYLEIQQSDSALSICTNDSVSTEYAISAAASHCTEYTIATAGPAPPAAAAYDSKKAKNQEKQVQKKKEVGPEEEGIEIVNGRSVEEKESRCGSNFFSAFGCPGGDDKELENAIIYDHVDMEDSSSSRRNCVRFAPSQDSSAIENIPTDSSIVSIASNELSFVIDYVEDDITVAAENIINLKRNMSDLKIVWSDSLLNEIKDVEKSLSVLEVKESASTQQMSNIKQHLLGHQQYIPEENKAEYCNALSRAAVLNARIEARRAELELKRIELEAMKVDAEMACMIDDSYDDVTLAMTESEYGGFFGFVTSLFKFTKDKGGSSVADSTAGLATSSKV